MAYFYVIKVSNQYDSLLKCLNQGVIQNSDIIDIVVQVNAGIKTLHQIGLLFLNLKLRSILIAKNEVKGIYNVIMIDFS